MSDVAFIGGAERRLGDEQVRAFLHEHLASLPVRGRRVCVVIPDRTRTCPVPLLVGTILDELRGRASEVTVLVALGTHAPLSDEAFAAHLGADAAALAERHPGVALRNHDWADPATFVRVGAISTERVAELSGGLLHTGVEVRVNRAVVDHDLTLLVGPVVPHEVVGFSGGNKYLFPGVSGPEMIDLTHWLGALITSAELIGRRGVTPVRALIDEAANLVPGPRLALCVVTGPAGSLHAAAFGDPIGAWAAAADVAAATHVRYLREPVERVLSLVPERYADLWTGAKGFYKVEPVVADGGQVVLYAPHIHQISPNHPHVAEVGYHCRDYFVKQWDRFRHVPWGDLAHATHLRGAGTYDPDAGERCRVRVTLATGIDEASVRAANLDHLDPAEVDPARWAADPHTLVVPDAGEDLYRLR